MRKVLAIVLIIALTMGLTSCGTKVMININDDGVITELETKIPRTVQKIIGDAGITLGEDDVVSPSLDTKLTEVQDIVIERKHTVKLTVDGKTESIDIVGGTVEDLLLQAGVKLGEKQVTSIALTEPLKEGMEVKIINQLTVIITCDGQTVEKNVDAANVGAAIEASGISLGADDRVTPETTSPVEDGMEITIDRVKIEEVTETEEIEYEVAYEYDNSKSKGTETVRVSGENGEKEVKYQITYVNGEEESREILEETIIKEPVTAVVVLGTYVAPSSSSSSSSSGGKKEVSRKAFYDCDGSGHGYYEITYSDGSKDYVQF